MLWEQCLKNITEQTKSRYLLSKHRGSFISREVSAETSQNPEKYVNIRCNRLYICWLNNKRTHVNKFAPLRTKGC